MKRTDWIKRASGLFVPPTLRWSPGYPCCCGPSWTAGDPCSTCSGDAPAQWLVTIEGMAGSSCEACDDLNGEYIATQSESYPCVWIWDRGDYGEAGCTYGFRFLIVGRTNWPGNSGLNIYWNYEGYPPTTQSIHSWFQELSSSDPCLYLDTLTEKAVLFTSPCDTLGTARCEPV